MNELIEQLKTMRCGYCGVEYDDQKHICLKGVQFILDYNNELRSKSAELLAALKALLDTTEELYEYADAWHWKYDEGWVAAIEKAKAAIKKAEVGK